MPEQNQIMVSMNVERRVSELEGMIKLCDMLKNFALSEIDTIAKSLKTQALKEKQDLRPDIETDKKEIPLNPDKK